eukprot:8432123-Lingulodinium_polyedra.AAC.1
MSRQNCGAPELTPALARHIVQTPRGRPGALRRPNWHWHLPARGRQLQGRPLPVAARCPTHAQQTTLRNNGAVHETLELARRRQLGQTITRGHT